MPKCVLVRHGESVWNLENRFTGWKDVDLSEQGVREAKEAGLLLKKNHFHFNLAFSSILKRANRTLDLILEQMDLDLKIVKSWKLNERHYGALTGLNKSDTAKKYGDEQVHIWRRSYDTPPPALSLDDPRHPSQDPLFKDIASSELPSTESLKDTVNRVIPYWNEVIVPEIKAGKDIIIVAHGNSLRALVMYLDDLSEEEITGVNIPTGSPLVYELDEDARALNSYYLKEKNS